MRSTSGQADAGKGWATGRWLAWLAVGFMVTETAPASATVLYDVTTSADAGAAGLPNPGPGIGFASIQSNYDSIAGVGVDGLIYNPGGVAGISFGSSGSPNVLELTSSFDNANAQSSSLPSMATATAMANLASRTVSGSAVGGGASPDAGLASSLAHIFDKLTFNIPGATASTTTLIGVNYSLGGAFSGSGGRANVLTTLNFGGLIYDAFGDTTAPYSEYDQGWISQTIGCQTTSCFNFQGVFAVRGANPTVPLTLDLRLDCAGEAPCSENYSGNVSFSLPQGVTYTAASTPSGSPTSAKCLDDISSGSHKPFLDPKYLSSSLLPTTITDTFSPSVGLAQAALDCGVIGFDWQQEYVLNNESGTACGDPTCDPNKLITIIPSTVEFDPHQYGYPYCNPKSTSYQKNFDCSNSYPYYYPPTVTSGDDCIEISSDGCQVHMYDGNQALNFYDKPDNANDDGSIDLKTQLVGIGYDGNPVLFPDVFRWHDDFSSDDGGGLGGILVAPINELVDDSSSGTGGITIIDDVVTTPEPSSVAILTSALCLLWFVRKQRRKRQ